MTPTRQIFTEDGYASTCDATVIAVTDQGIVLDQTVFYAASGGQPGDTGFLEKSDGSRIEITATTYQAGDKTIIEHAVSQGTPLPETGDVITAHIDWERRYKLQRMHTACHILSVVLPLPITGAAVGENESRIDFDMTDTADKAELSNAMMDIVNANHPIFTRLIDEADLDKNPDLVKSKNVKPPRGVGKIRLVCIGEDANIDSQPCGGTHVSETKEVGEIHIGKIEKKGRENRRMRIRFGALPQT